MERTRGYDDYCIVYDNHNKRVYRVSRVSSLSLISTPVQTQPTPGDGPVGMLVLLSELQANHLQTRPYEWQQYLGTEWFKIIRILYFSW